jgi:putative transposase
MKKGEIRREFFKLRLQQKSYSKCKTLLQERHKYSVSIRTLKRWQQRFSKEDEWNLRDNSTKPNKIYYKITQQAIKEILVLRKKTGWGACKLKVMLPHLNLSHQRINTILHENGLTRKENNRGKRAKYVRFQRKHSNSLWHIDDSEFGKKGKIIAVIDDCSRYCLGILHTNTVTTVIVTKFLDELIKKFGSPREIISDNGSSYGLRSKNSRFDRWCKRRGIKHIRTRVNRPQTNGKVERLFQTIKKEIELSNNDLELFRMKYNHYRPHQSLHWLTPAQEFHEKLYW